MERYDTEVGLPAGLPVYDLEDLQNPPVGAFVESKRSGKPTQLTGRTKDGKLATAVFVVTDLRKVQNPDQEETIARGALCYFPNPDLVGIGEVKERSAKGGGLVVVNRVMFHLVRLDDSEPNAITYGTLLFLDRQP